jgi:hypothetical protein
MRTKLQTTSDEAAVADAVGGGAPTDTTAAAAPNPFDLASLQLDQSFIETVGVRKLLTTVPLRKPNAQDFIRVRPEPEFRGNFATIELKDERETYILLPHIAREMSGEYATTVLYTTINRQGVVSLWPVKLMGPDGRLNEWHRSAAKAAETAMTKWVRVKANMSLGGYETWVAEGTTVEPEWPSLSFQQLVEIACKDGHLVNSFDHPVIKRLRGLA